MERAVEILVWILFSPREWIISILSTNQTFGRKSTTFDSCFIFDSIVLSLYMNQFKFDGYNEGISAINKHSEFQFKAAGNLNWL